MDENLDNKKRALELIELMKNGKLSIEQLKAIIPMTTNFIKELCGALKEEITNSRQSHIEAVQTLGKSIDALKEIGKVEDCSDDIKKAVIERISDISNMVREMQKAHEDNSDKRALIAMSILGMLATLVIILSSNSNQKTNE